MLVRQQYAGWYGIKLGNWCSNKDVNFCVTSRSMEAQLIETSLTYEQLEVLYKGIKQQRDFAAKEDMLRYLEKKMKGLAK